MKNQQVNSKIRIEKEREQFYTSKSCVNHVMTLAIDFLVTRGVKIDKDTAFIEPSAGTGNFMIWLKEKGYKVAGYDLEPKMDGIIKQDFYKLSIKHDKKNIVIGNPPFGYKSKMALDFLNKSLEFSDIVIFILPMQFKRFLTQKNITPSGKLIFSSPKLEKNSFIFKDKPYNVNCIFQIWVKNIKKFELFEDLRLKHPLPNKHEHFKTWIYNNTQQTFKYFDKKKYKWDFAVVRQGYYDYTEIISDPKKLNSKRQYLFVKIINPVAKKIFSLISFKELSESNTSVKGFSNTDLVRKYEEILGRKSI
ncbi:MAG: hypothetical protein LBC44_02635 [Mycoplasmataceae bacterium]|nr:hypothetical protein [Mycoplasmataceae bacterium]